VKVINMNKVVVQYMKSVKYLPSENGIKIKQLAVKVGNQQWDLLIQH